MLLGKKALGTVGYMGGVMAIPEPFTWSWGQMIQYNAESLVDDSNYIHYVRATISDHGPARNSMIEGMYGDWIVMLDTDHRFDPDIVARLVRTANKYGVDVLTGFYQFKKTPHSPVWYMLNEAGMASPIMDWDKGAEILQIGACGAGCLFIRKNVFEIVGKHPFDRFEGLSEDHSFCRRLFNKGVKLYGAPNIECHHLAFNEIDKDDIDISKYKTTQIQVEGFNG